MMITYRKGQVGDIENIIKTANESFIPVRDKSFDFSKVMPFAYGKGIDSSNIHQLAFDGKKMVGLAGNVINEFNLDRVSYPYSFVGTVSVIPSYQKKGIMKQLMKRTDETNEKEKVVFSLLTGSRDRYRFYDYHLFGIHSSYKIVINNIIHHACDESKISIDEYSSSKEKELYDVYLKTDLNIRAEENFINRLKIHDDEIYIININSSVRGYFSYSRKDNTIHEIKVFGDYNLASLYSMIFKKLNIIELTVEVSSLDHKTNSFYSSFCESVSLTKPLMIKVYDFFKFLSFIFSLNENKNLDDGDLNIGIDKNVYHIQVRNGKTIVIMSDKMSDIDFTEEEFLNNQVSMGSLIDTKAFTYKNWFPLFFDLLEPDQF